MLHQPPARFLGPGLGDGGEEPWLDALHRSC
jgi:hypothetical protein